MVRCESRTGRRLGTGLHAVRRGAYGSGVVGAGGGGADAPPVPSNLAFTGVSLEASSPKEALEWLKVLRHLDETDAEAEKAATEVQFLHKDHYRKVALPIACFVTGLCLQFTTARDAGFMLLGVSVYGLAPKIVPAFVKQWFKRGKNDK